MPQTIEDAVRTSGGTYLMIDPKIVSPSNAPDTLQSGGLTKADDRGGSKILVPGVKLYGKLESRLDTHAYAVNLPAYTERTITVDSKEYPIFIKFLDGDTGSILWTDNTVRYIKGGGFRSIIWNAFEPNKNYIVELFLNTEALPDFDPEAPYSASYFIGFEEVR